MAVKMKSNYPLGEMPARVLTGKVLMKAGADRVTLRALRTLIGELEIDRKPLVLTAAFPTMLWTGSKDAHVSPDGSDDDPERPVILVSILDRVANTAQVQQITQTWREQQLSGGSPTFLLASVDRHKSVPSRLLERVIPPLAQRTRLEKTLIATVALQLLGGVAWVSKAPIHRPVAPSANAAVVTAALPLGPLATSPVSSPRQTRSAVKQSLIKKLPRVVLDEFVYYNGGKLTVRWKPASAAALYRVYVGNESDLSDARLVTPKSILATEYTWTKNTSANYLAVRVTDAQGHLGALSEIIDVSL
jgi:hypothetical protein